MFCILSGPLALNGLSFQMIAIICFSLSFLGCVVDFVEKVCNYSFDCLFCHGFDRKVKH